MNRRPFLQTLASGSTLLAAGCIDSIPFTGNQLEPAAVFENHRFEGTELIIRFHDGITVEKAVLFNSATDEKYEMVDQPGKTVRFPVVFPHRLDTYVSKSLHVKAKTSNGWISQRISDIVHAYTETVDVLRDGRARFTIENQGDASLLVRFVGIYGDVPNPTVNPQSDSFDRSSFNLGPSIVGIGSNRPLSPSRTDLVVSPGETAPFETIYSPFVFSDDSKMNTCDGNERTAHIVVVHTSGGSAAYTFSYRLSGELNAVEGQPAEICGDIETDIDLN